MRRARSSSLFLWLLVAPAVFAQGPPADDDDLDVTMRVIVDPDAKVPDEIVRKIPLPKPAQPATPRQQPDADKAKDGGKPADPGKPRDAGNPDTPAPANTPAAPAGAPPAPDARERGREFGQDVAREAKERSEEARRNKDPPPPPDAPPGRPPNPRRPDR